MLASWSVTSVIGVATLRRRPMACRLRNARSLLGLILLPTVLLGSAQSRGVQSAEQFSRVDRDRAGFDQPLLSIAGDVVVIMVEAAFGNGVRRGEGVQLVEGCVTDQVCPHPAVGGPARRVDQYGHALRV